MLYGQYIDEVNRARDLFLADHRPLDEAIPDFEAALDEALRGEPLTHYVGRVLPFLTELRW